MGRWRRHRGRDPRVPRRRPGTGHAGPGPCHGAVHRHRRLDRDATRLGGRRWPDLASEHHRPNRRELARFRGREIASAGDGFVAAFGGQRGRCASPSRWFTPYSRRESRWEILDDKLVGVAVSAGARLAAAAGPSEVLTTGMVKDPVGSGIGFDDRGIRPLKGLPGQWRLFSVLNT